MFLLTTSLVFMSTTSRGDETTAPKAGPDVTEPTPDKPGKDQKPETPAKPENPGNPEKPEVVERPEPQMPEEVKAKVDAFRTAREKYLAEKNEAVRARRQELTQEQRVELKERVKASQEDYRKRLREIKDDFKSKKEAGELLEAAKEKKRDRRGED